MSPENPAGRYQDYSKMISLLELIILSLDRAMFAQFLRSVNRFYSPYAPAVLWTYCASLSFS